MSLLPSFAVLLSISILVPVIGCNAYDKRLKNLLRRLNKAIQPALNVYLFEGLVNEIFENMLEDDMPRVIIARNAAEVPLNVNSKILVLKTLTAGDDFERQVKHIDTALAQHTSRSIDVLFITDATIGQHVDFRSVFMHCWAHGFRNVLLTDRQGTMLTYQPFPAIGVMRTTLIDFLAQRNNWRNLHGYFVNISYAKDIPYTLDIYNRGRYGGVMPLFFEQALKYFNGTTDNRMFEELADPQENCFRSLSAGAHLCGNLLYYPHNMGKYLNYMLIQLNLEPGVLVVPCAGPLPESQYLLAPFTRGLWLLICATCSYVACMLSAAHRFQTGVWHWGRFIMAAIRFPLNMWVDFKFLRRRCRYALSILLFVIGFMISNLYLARMSSIRATRLRSKEINTREELIASNLSIRIQKFNLAYLEQYDIPLGIRKKFRPFDWIRNLSVFGNDAYFLRKIEARCRLFRERFKKYPERKILKNVHLYLPVGIPIHRRSPFILFFERLFQYARNGDLLHGIFKHLMTTRNTRTQVFYAKREQRKQRDALNLRYFSLLFMLWACGLVLAFLVFLFELSLKIFC